MFVQGWWLRIKALFTTAAAMRKPSEKALLEEMLASPIGSVRTDAQAYKTWIEEAPFEIDCMPEAQTQKLSPEEHVGLLTQLDSGNLPN